jgi:hypothetical protein
MSSLWAAFNCICIRLLIVFRQHLRFVEQPPELNFVQIVHLAHLFLLVRADGEYRFAQPSGYVDGRVLEAWLVG